MLLVMCQCYLAFYDKITILEMLLPFLYQHQTACMNGVAFLPLRSPAVDLERTRPADDLCQCSHQCFNTARVGSATERASSL